MNLILPISVALGFSAFTVAGLHYYSVLESKTRNDFVRLLIYLLCLAVFLFGPVVCFSLLFPRFKETPRHSDAAVLLFWLLSILVYIALNWKALLARLRVPRS
jgi:ABC-type polysaccharide/polyol phosphate export permease